MNKKNKLRLAKEILYFFFGIFCILVLWSIIETKNYILNKKIESISINTLTFTKQIDSIDKIKVLDKYLTEKLKSNIDEMIHKGFSDEEIINMIVVFKKKFEKKEIKVKRNQLENAKRLSLKHYYETKNKLIDYNEKIKILSYSVFIIMGLIYPLRLAYYSLVWSVRTLKK